jgi:putative redox protein
MIRATAEEERYLIKYTNGTSTGYADVHGAEGGTGTGFRSHELLEAALATCIAITLRVYAEKHDLPLENVAVEVRLDHGTTGESVFHYDLELYGSALSPEQKTKLLEIAKACAVRRTLSKPIRFESASESTAETAARASAW